jgi:PleD family two-component response regulator
VKRSRLFNKNREISDKGISIKKGDFHEKVLIIDGKKDLIMLYTGMMQAEGYEVLTAINGQKAMNLLKSVGSPT